MDYRIEDVTCDNKDFIELCKKLDEFQNEIFPERVILNMSALQGLEKLEKIYLMYDGDKAIATGGLKRVDDVSAELARMYTDGYYRGQGLAKIIIEKVQEYAKSVGYKTLVLDTWKDSTSARQLYLNMGFIEREPFDPEAFKNSFSTYDTEIQEKIEDKLVFMEKKL
ncbi:MAG: GNAT family N-acetyltransferase [Bacilli bacterium]|nr:GNAT family N-acetyltransferase [Bacilli bacterium]